MVPLTAAGGLEFVALAVVERLNVDRAGIVLGGCTRTRGERRPRVEIEIIQRAVVVLDQHRFAVDVDADDFEWITNRLEPLTDAEFTEPFRNESPPCAAHRSDARRGGHEWVSKCSFRGSPYRYKTH